MAPISIRGNTVDPSNPADVKAKGLRLDGLISEHILIQISGRLDATSIKILQDNHIELQQNVDKNDVGQVWLCHCASKDLPKLKTPPLTGFVKGAIDYDPFFKTQPRLKTTSDVQQTFDIGIALHQDAYSTIESLQNYLRNSLKITGIMTASNGIIQLRTGDKKSLEEIAKQETVEAIEEIPHVVLSNDRTRNTVALDQMDHWLANELNASALTGEGESVFVADTGIDKDHSAFSPDKIRAIYKRAYEPASDSDDRDGHGTHVAGTVVAMAPNAKIIAQSVVKDTADLSPVPFPDIVQVFDKAYNDGARILNNSWGPDTTKANHESMEYASTNARKLDEITFNRPDLLIIFAAGNNRQSTTCPDVGAWAAAKNVLTVGASLTDRKILIEDDLPLGKVGSYTFDSRGRGGVPGDVNEIANFSSKGPTKEGRLKPDIVAPGVLIRSARSHVQHAHNQTKTLDGFYLLGSPDPDWVFSSGTSMAAPAVSGCATLLREALAKLPDIARRPNIVTSALLKALLVNGAHDTSAKQSGPDGLQGFGRLNMIATMRPIATPNGLCNFAVGDIDSAKKAQNPLIETKVKSPSPLPKDCKGVLKVSLAYTDTAGKFLQVQLELQVGVTAAGATEPRNFRGFTGFGQSENTVQQVLIPDLKGADEVTIRLASVSVPYGGSHWAIVWDFY